MDIEPPDDKDRYSGSFDYNHSRIGSSLQSVDYNHGQAGSSDYMRRTYDDPAVSFGGAPVDHGSSMYGAGGYSSYQGYEGYSGTSGMPYQSQDASFFSGLDPAAIFAAYTEQTGTHAVISQLALCYVNVDSNSPPPPPFFFSPPPPFSTWGGWGGDGGVVVGSARGWVGCGCGGGSWRGWGGFFLVFFFSPPPPPFFFFPPLPFLCVCVCVCVCEGGGDLRRKGIPLWLKDELDKMDRKRKRDFEKEEQEKLRDRSGRTRPAWREDEDSGGDEPSEVRNRDWGRREDRHRSSRLFGHTKSSSPESVSFQYCKVYFLCIHFNVYTLIGWGVRASKEVEKSR